LQIDKKVFKIKNHPKKCTWDDLINVMTNNGKERNLSFEKNRKLNEFLQLSTTK
jgi:hypothetical protein